MKPYAHFENCGVHHRVCLDPAACAENAALRARVAALEKEVEEARATIAHMTEAADLIRRHPGSLIDALLAAEAALSAATQKIEEADARADRLDDALTAARANVDGTGDALMQAREAVGIKSGDSLVEAIKANLAALSAAREEIKRLETDYENAPGWDQREAWEHGATAMRQKAANEARVYGNSESPCSCGAKHRMARLASVIAALPLPAPKEK